MRVSNFFHHKYCKALTGFFYVFTISKFCVQNHLDRIVRDDKHSFGTDNHFIKTKQKCYGIGLLAFGFWLCNFGMGFVVFCFIFPSDRMAFINQ